MNDEEREIDLKLMFAYVFKQWRKILIATLVCGLLGIGYKLIKVVPNYSSLKDTYTSNMASYEASVKSTEDQKKKNQNIIDQLTEYSQKSIKANIDPYSEIQTTANISIVTAKGQDDFEALLSGTNHANQIAQAYASYINKEITFSEIADKLGINNQLVKELISVDTNYDTDTVKVTVIGSNLDTTEEIMNYILVQTNGNESKIRSEYGDYTVVISTPSNNTVIDNSLVTPVSTKMLSPNLTMNDTLSKISTLQTNLNTISSSVAAEPISVNTTIEKDLVKYFIIGLILGICVSIILRAIFFAFSRKIYSEADVKLITRARILTVIPSKINEKHKTKFDRLIIKKIDSAYGIGSDVALQKAEANIEACQGNFKKLLLINANTNQDIEDLKSKLKFLNRDVELHFSEDINVNADELKKLKDSDGVILAIERNKTKIEDVLSISETVDNWQKPIIGCIVL